MLVWSRIVGACIAVGSLVLIGIGAWLIYPPAAFLAVGLLVWIDLSWAARERHERNRNTSKRRPLDLP